MEELSDFNGKKHIELDAKENKKKGKDNLRGGATLKNPPTPWIKKKNYRSRIMERQFMRELE